MGNYLSLMFGSKKKEKHGRIPIRLSNSNCDNIQTLKRTSTNELPSTKHVHSACHLQEWLKQLSMVMKHSEFFVDEDIGKHTVCLVLLLIARLVGKNAKPNTVSVVHNEDQTDYPIKRQIEEPIRKENTSVEYTSPAIFPKDDSTDFPFLNDDKTVSHIKSSNTMFIMRGISGSGKSTIVNIIRSIYPEVVVCSADFYFVQEDGNYHFQQDLLPYAHGDCQDQAKDACYRQINVVVIDNTNIRRWEMKPYLDMARDFNYVVVLVRPRTKWCNDPYELFKRSKHGVDFSIIEKKIRTFEDIIPFYYGWFFNISDSVFLYQLGTSYLEPCLASFPHFTRRWFWEDTDVTLAVLQQYFNIDPNGSNFILHCTSFYCGSRKNPTTGREEYHQSEKVQRSCGQVSRLQITGITISPRAVTARIKLNPDQLVLLCKPEEIQRDKMIYNKSGLQNTGLSNQDYPQKGRCVHVTLATASGIGASQANFDLLDIYDREHFLSTTGRQIPTYPVDRGVIKCLDDEYCVVNFSQPIFINGLFSGLY